MTSRKRTIPRPVHFETTIPVIRPCQRCGVWFAAGVAEGVKAQVELVQPLDTYQKLWAITHGIELYVIRRVGLVRMDADRLAGPYLGEIYPQHKCEVIWPRVTKPPDILSGPDIPPY